MEILIPKISLNEIVLPIWYIIGVVVSRYYPEMEFRWIDVRVNGFIVVMLYIMTELINNLVVPIEPRSAPLVIAYMFLSIPIACLPVQFFKWFLNLGSSVWKKGSQNIADKIIKKTENIEQATDEIKQSAKEMKEEEKTKDQ